MTEFLMIIRRFPTTFQRFLKIFQNCSEGQTNVPKHFPKNFREFPKFPKISEDCGRLSRKTRRCFDVTPSNLSTVYETNLMSVKSSISSHVRISYRFLSICYHSVYHWLLYNKCYYVILLNVKKELVFHQLLCCCTMA